VSTPWSSLAPAPLEHRDIANKLLNHGYSFEQGPDGIWTVVFPVGHSAPWSRVSFHRADLGQGLLRLLREEEQQTGTLHRYEQNDERWRKIVYGNSKHDTTIGEAGCGPTSLAMLLQYLMNNGSRPRNACFAVAPPETAAYAASHGRVSGHGTNADKMIKDIQTKWPQFEGMRVTPREAVQLVSEGKLILFLSRGCRGYSASRPLHREPDVTYGGHYMILAGVEGTPGPGQVFYVIDGGRRAARAMRYIKYSELEHHGAGYWWVYQRDELTGRSSSASH
jgi:hypothetical protein